MSLVIPPGFGQASIEIRNGGDPSPWYITHGVDLSFMNGAPEAACETIALAFAQTIGGGLSDTSTITGVRLVIGEDAEDNLVVFTPFDFPGESSAEKLPQNCALLIDKTSASGGRRNRGRMFVPNVLGDTSVNNVGVIDGAVLTDIQTFCNQWFTNLEDGFEDTPPTPMVILHNSIGAGVQPAPTPVTGLRAQGVISTQRRRLR